MDAITTALGALLAVSVALDILLLTLLRRAKKKPPAAPSLDATQLLHDLTTTGQAVLHVTVIDPKNLFLRRPRG